MKRLAILGASGHGKVVAEAAECEGWENVFFYDDRWPELLTSGRWSVIGDTAKLLLDYSCFDGVVVAIGHNPTRLEKLTLLAAQGIPLPTIVHPNAVVSSHSCLGAGTVIMAGAVVNVDTRVGVGCIVNTCASVDHDCVLYDGVHISPGAHLAGGISIGNCSWVGIGVCVRQSLCIGADVIIGAGSTVLHDVPDKCTVAGVPARPLG